MFLEKKLGHTYFTEVGLNNDADITKVPDPVIKPSFSPVQLCRPHFIIMDLETTGLSMFFFKD